jgi:Flp pilus assembly protein TadG
MSKLLHRRGRYYFERGATLVEATFLIPILLLLAIGLSEVGLTVIDWMAVSNASREGARVGAAAGSNATSDDLILQVVGQASCAIDNGELTSVRIYKSDLNGDMVSNAENVYTLNSLNCATKTASWTTNTFSWPPASRNDKIDNLDILAVEITFDHDSITGFLPLFDGTWIDKATMRLEPDTRG